jgi:hypothetical protein
METKRFRARLRVSRAALAMATLACVAAIPWSDTHAGAPPFGVNWHVVSSGGHALSNSCFRLSGTAGQAAPGYSSGPTDSIVAGFWPVAPTTGLDEIFFNGFEDC